MSSQVTAHDAHFADVKTSFRSLQSISLCIIWLHHYHHSDSNEFWHLIENSPVLISLRMFPVSTSSETFPFHRTTVLTTHQSHFWFAPFLLTMHWYGSNIAELANIFLSLPTIDDEIMRRERLQFNIIVIFMNENGNRGKTLPFCRHFGHIESCLILFVMFESLQILLNMH